MSITWSRVTRMYYTKCRQKHVDYSSISRQFIMLMSPCLCQQSVYGTPSSITTRKFGTRSTSESRSTRTLHVTRPCEQYKDSSDRYRSPQALLKHVLECETALVRFKKVTRSTPIAGLTESDCTCSGNACRKMVALNASFEKQLIRSTSLNPDEIKLRSPYF